MTYGDRGAIGRLEARPWIEVSPGRSICLVPLAMGLGIAVYFSLVDEPSAWVSPVVLVLSLIPVYALRHLHIALISAILLAAAVAGFAFAQWETARCGTRFLVEAFGPGTLTGRVVATEPLATGARLTVEDLHLGALEPYETPNRVRVTSRGQGAGAIRAGDWIRATAKLSPPSGPQTPGGFDFRRHAYFERIGATGFSYGTPDIVRKGGGPDTGVSRFGDAIDTLRATIARRIMVLTPRDSGAVAAALLTGHRQAIPDSTAETMRNAGLAHLLAISGLHIGLIAGLVFFVVRAFLALMPAIALHHPIKKWAAVAAFLAALFYTVLAGASVPTQRAFIMTAFVMAAILIDRRAITLRVVAFAAMVVLAKTPHSLMEPGFQMSFAAVTALVAAYEVLGPHFRQWFPVNASTTRRVAGYIAGVATSTLIAGTTTAPFALYHFQHSAVYGLLANLVAIPLTALWILPSGLVALVTMPFGGEAVPLSIMTHGIDVVLGVAARISQLPNSVFHTPSLPNLFIALVTLGGLFLALSRGRLRPVGILPLIAAAWIAVVYLPPDLLVSADGRIVARGDGEIVDTGSIWGTAGRFTRELVLAAVGQPDSGSVNDQPAAGLRCDSLGCRWVHDGQKIAVDRSEGGLVEDCWSSDILIASFPLRRPCPGPKLVIDRFDLWRGGAAAINLGKNGSIHVRYADPVGDKRPWSRQEHPRVRASVSTGG